jgi:hypothetical protein
MVVAIVAGEAGSDGFCKVVRWVVADEGGVETEVTAEEVLLLLLLLFGAIA